MKDVILLELEKIEKSEGVKILHCVESGSRAWGFASPDSDFDVRFIYARPQSYYLQLEEGRDVIEWKLDDVLDINGWDISKTLRLLHASNPTLFEWSSSPIVYTTTPQWAKIADIAPRYFLRRKGLHHYLSMAEGNYSDYLTGERVKLKKYFYVLRPILACMWILERGTPPPMRFEELAKCCLPAALGNRVEKLLKIKTSAPEIGTVPRDDILNGYITESFASVRARIEKLPDDDRQGWEELNAVFAEITREV